MMNSLHVEKCQEIKKQIENHFSIKDLGEHTRKRQYINCRMLYYHLCQHLTLSSLATIGYCLNPVKPFNHATVLNGMKRYAEYKSTKYFKPYIFASEILKPIIRDRFKVIDIQLSLDINFDTIHKAQAHYRTRLIEIIEKAKSVIDNRDSTIKSLRNDLNKILNIEVIKPITVKF